MAPINLRNALMAGKRLPFDAEVEYLESTGTQWIDTGIIPVVSNYFRSIVKVAATRTDQDDIFFIGMNNNSNGSDATQCYQAGYYQHKQRIRLKDQAWYLSPIDTSVHIWDMNGAGGTTIDGEIVTTARYKINGITQLGLFARKNYGGTNLFPGAFRMFYCKIYSDDTLVRDFIPVRKGTVGYLYDRVSGKLFGNAGTGDFVLGPDVVPVEYIESHGTEYIDTGIKGKPGYDFESAITFTQLSNSVASAIGGVYGSNVACYIGIVRTNKTFAYIFDGAPIVEFSSATPNTHYIVKSHQFSGSQYLEINGVRSAEGVTSATFESTGNIYLMSVNNLSGTQVFSHMKMSYCRIYFNSAPVRSFRPVRVGSGSTWEGAMMDVLTRRIYRNAGTGAFSYGNDLKYPIPAA